MTNHDETLLWHYTRRDPAEKIISFRSFWASSILFLNDSTEFDHLRDLITEWIKITPSNVGGWGDPKDVPYFLKGSQTVVVESFRKSLFHPSRMHAYIISLTTVRDDLSQWRAYGTGGGMSLGFSKGELTDVAESAGFQLEDCIYDDAVKRSLVHQLMVKHVAEYDKVAKSLERDDLLNSSMGSWTFSEPMKDLLRNFYADAQRLACRIKSSAFAAERECRLIGLFAPNAKDVRFRHNDSMTVPYRVFSMEKDGKLSALRKIVAGPSPHIDLNHLAFQGICLHNGLLDVEITDSSIPFRFW
ncbi:DUF2971 domain-containing protein [Undibacterium terreum]|uniref:DUF2971 domain-containing protein n=1 Tax=Undibacterium terreum TaxID=1224302 RepID=A0A916X9S5_9BURK|nr:DUF2971 domain-containing protein [Undibacterium terreum]GGC57698.1 hypothetical protein GCM10011396_00690 [Undibacterium terreum]